MNKLQETEFLLQMTLLRSARAEKNWMRFLKISAQFYKYGFNDQVLIYAQKPDATACAEIEIWNRLDRWVRKDTKGIALIVGGEKTYKLRYVFDVSDTISRRERDIKLWMYQDEYAGKVKEALASQFGASESKKGASFEEFIKDTVDRIAQDDPYIERLNAAGYAAESIKIITNLVKNSAAFQILTRCGVENGISSSDFKDISLFDTPDAISKLGNAISRTVEIVLREIERTVKEEQKQKKLERSDEYERGQNDSGDARTDLSSGGRLSDPRPQTAEVSGHREVRHSEEKIPEREPQGRIRRDVHDGTDRGAGAGRPGSDGDGRKIDKTDGAGTGSERSTQSVRSDGVGAEDEQHPSGSRGNSLQHADLRLSGHNFNARSELPYFHNTDEKNEMLRTCSELREHHKEIAAFFEIHEDHEERGDFVKSFFLESEPVEHMLESGEKVGYIAYDDLLHVWKGSYNARESEVFLPWWSVANSIYGQILLDTWLSPTEHTLPTVKEQIAFIDAAAEKEERFKLPQAAIDYVLAGGSGVEQGKLRIYEQFQKQETSEKNIAFLKNEYGIGGHSDAIPGTNYWMDSDGKGIGISILGKPESETLLPWNKVATRIGELIAADRYLSPKEKEAYPAYKRGREARAARSGIAERFKLVVNDFNDFETQLNNTDIVFKEHEINEYASCFVAGSRKTSRYNLQPSVFVLPAMRAVLIRIITEDTHLTERAQAVLDELTGDLAKPFELTETELNPLPEPPKEYQFALGDTVYIGTKMYEIFSLDDPVQLFDPRFPLLTEEMSKEDFMKKASENSINDKYLKPISEKTASDVSGASKAANEEAAASKGTVWNEYLSAKAEHPEAVILYRVGDFYEVFGDDAEPVARDVSLVITSRDVDLKERVRMCGFPAHRLEEYIGKLHDKGYNIAIYENGKTRIVESQEHEADIELAKKLINDYCKAEFNQEADFTDLKAVGLAFTTVTDAEIETQVNANLEDFTIDRYIGNVLVEQRRYTNLSEMCAELRSLDFNELVSYTDAQIESAINSHEEQTTVLDTPSAEEKTIPAIEPQMREQHASQAIPAVLFPEINSERSNFRIDNENIGVRPPIERLYHNLAAISLLHKIESEHRLANSVEQGVLSEYVGWGGLAEFFEETNPHNKELRKILSEEEYISARESTLTAFYTPPVVIKSIYKALEGMGFKTGNILEPSCGIGNFMGLIPESMKESRMYGVELDSISGRIAQQLYQKNNIAVQGFEKTELPDSFFDAAVGNVPFGQFKVSDKRYDKLNFSIHDYFFAKTLDKVRPGGVIAFITSRYMMDKADPSVRKYIAQRADFLGAIRLPNNTFKDAAGTDVTSDIIFLQKRDRPIEIEPDWVHLAPTNTIIRNQYFADNPDMIMGEMQVRMGPHGPEPTCVPFKDKSLEEGLNAAIRNIKAEIPEIEFDDEIDKNEDNSIPADPTVRNYSFTVIDGKVYYRSNSRMSEATVSATAEKRIKGMVKLRDCVRELIEYQMEDYPDEMIRSKQTELNELYDEFVKTYGYINSRANNSAFNCDDSYYLLTSLERFDDEGNFIGKADMFSKRTIRKKVIVTSVDTASEALALSLAEKACVDMPYMCGLTGKTEQQIAEDLHGVIFLNPLFGYGNSDEKKYVPADEYLSGNIREKLAAAKKSAELHPDDYAINVQALEQVMPKELSASEISVRLGSTWLPVEDINEFMWDLFQTPYWQRRNIHVNFSQYTGEWSIEGKSHDRTNYRTYNTYGTDRINSYKILEETLNLRDVRVFDYIEDDNGRKNSVLNRKETAIAQSKQQLIKEAFTEWIWKDPQRRTRLTKLYNEKFNSTRPREYDGSHLSFAGMNPEITLRKHQSNAIAHMIYGGNTLLAHVVGAGKTYEMVAAAQEMKRLGLCHKSLFVVPNHLTEQWAGEYLRLYPSANILVATKKDFETKNRKKFCGRIATGDYDAVIIGHSQFEKLPMSVERQIEELQKQEQEILDGIEDAKRNRGERFTVKQMEKARKTIRLKLDKLNDQSRKDDVVTFEELGVDRLFVDEAHYYKNLAAFTKMRNVGGISQTEAMKSSDLYMKCRYLDELTGGRGVVFATGTPISNSMVEMYTMQKYLQYHTLENGDLVHFDSWASTFGETVTAIELAPEGNGYRAKTRFAKFYNLPELMNMFKEVADVQTADMLKLPVPKANYHNVALKPSEQQKEMVKELSERAERVRSRMVNSNEDNMLCITNDGRKLALDQRLLNELLPDSETGKVTACADNVYDIWARTKDERSTQLVFCDLSTPKNDGKFNVYDDLKAKLIAKGIPAEEIAFVHFAETEQQKSALFGKVRNGTIRVLIGSTQKMGAGTNVQKRLIALHHLDCPWRPADLQQREGRIIRQGNENPEVDIYTYVTENTFDSYLYQLVESKQKFIGQIMTSKSPVRSAEDVDEQALSYAEIKALCTGNPYIKEKMDLDIDVSRLKLLKASHLSQHYALEDKILKEIPQAIASFNQRIEGYKEDRAHAERNTLPNAEGFSPMILQGVTYDIKKEAGTELIAICKAMKNPRPFIVGSYRGFQLELSYDTMNHDFKLTLINQLRHTVSLGTDIYGNIQRLDNVISSFSEKQKTCEQRLEDEKEQLESARAELDNPFAHEDELASKSARLAELNALLDLGKKDNEIVDGETVDEVEREQSQSRNGKSVPR